MPSPSFTEGERLIRRPAHSADLSLRARIWDRVTLGGSLTVVGKRDDVDFAAGARLVLPAYALVDLAGELQILQPAPGRPGLSGTMRVENLFDGSYAQVVGFAGRPRAIFGGARLSF